MLNHVGVGGLCHMASVLALQHSIRYSSGSFSANRQIVEIPKQSYLRLEKGCGVNRKMTGDSKTKNKRVTARLRRRQNQKSTGDGQIVTTAKLKVNG